MSYYFSHEEDEAHRKGERDASYGRHRDYEYDCHFGGDVDKAYCEGYSEEERRQERMREEREEEERDRARQEREHERFLQQQYEQQLYEQQQYEYDQQQQQQYEEEQYEPPMEQEFSAMQGGTDGG
jgi:hypothetical protein